MDYHGIDMVGKLKVETLPTLPTWTANDESREIYTSDTGKRWYGSDTAWVDYDPTITLVSVTDITATAAEVNTVADGATAKNVHTHILASGATDVTASAAEVNKIDGFTGTFADLNYAKDLNATGVTPTEFDTALDGILATATEINTTSDGPTAKNNHTHLQATGATDVTATALEINTVADGATAKNVHTHILTSGATDVTATATELNNTSDGDTAKNSHNHTLAVGATDVTVSAEKINNLIDNVVEDTSPELGGELDAGAHSIGYTLQTLTGDGTDTIDWKKGNKMQFTCTSSNETFTFTAPSNPCNLLLEIIQDAVGGRDITFPANVKWLGTEPTWSDGGASKTIVMSMWYNGTNYWSQGTPWEV